MDWKCRQFSNLPTPRSPFKNWNMELGEVENMWRVRYERLKRDQHARFYRVVLKLPFYTLFLLVSLAAAYLLKEYLGDAVQLWEDLKVAVLRKREEMLVGELLKYARERDIKALEEQMLPTGMSYYLQDYERQDWYLENKENLEAFKKDIGAIEPPVPWEERKQVLMYYWNHRSRELMLDLTAEVINQCLFYIAPKIREWRLSRRHLQPLEPDEQLMGLEGEALIEDPSYMKHERLTLVVDTEVFTNFQPNIVLVGPTPQHMVGADVFFSMLDEYYEFVIWCNLSVMDGPLSPINDFYALGASQDHFFLWGDSMNEDHEGNEFKDLTYMNRDMSKLVLLDTDPLQQKMYPENTLLVKRYDGVDNHEKYLEMCEYIMFLYNLALYVIGDEGGDVRHIIGPFNRKIGPKGKYKDTLSALVGVRTRIQNRALHPYEAEWLSFFETSMVYLHRYDADWIQDEETEVEDHFAEEEEPYDEEDVLYDTPNSESPVWGMSPTKYYPDAKEDFKGIGAAVRAIPNLAMKPLTQEELKNYQDLDPADFVVDIKVEEEPQVEGGGAVVAGR